MLDFKRYEMDYIKSNMYILLNGKEALIIDPNVSEEGFQLLKEKGIQTWIKRNAEKIEMER